MINNINHWTALVFFYYFFAIRVNIGCCSGYGEHPGRGAANCWQHSSATTIHTSVGPGGPRAEDNAAAWTSVRLVGLAVCQLLVPTAASASQRHWTVEAEPRLSSSYRWVSPLTKLINCKNSDNFIVCLWSCCLPRNDFCCH